MPQAICFRATPLSTINAILDFGMQTFGLEQATKYHFEMEACFKLLFPGTGSFDIHPDLNRHPYKSRAIFSVQLEHLLIVRVQAAS
jgi:plasmid stabilization system protein ParE